MQVVCKNMFEGRSLLSAMPDSACHWLCGCHVEQVSDLACRMLQPAQHGNHIANGMRYLAWQTGGCTPQTCFYIRPALGIIMLVMLLDPIAMWLLGVLY